MANFRFGKHPPVTDYRTLRFTNYLKSDLAKPPATFSVLDRVYKGLGLNDPTKLYPMDGNDTYGDCTIAAAAHAITTWRGMMKKDSIPGTKAVEKLYFHLTGGADTGLNELNVLNSWRQNGALGEKMLAFATIDPKNHTHIQQAIQLFGGVYLGFQVQENCIQEFNAHKPWTPGTLTNDGHAVFAVGYDQHNVTVLTWGNTQLGTWAWWDECVDEAYAILPVEAKTAGFCPGFNVTQLEADLKDVAN
jgi:hypothetical protein